MQLTIEVSAVLFSPSTAASGYAATTANNDPSSSSITEPSAALHISGRVSQEAKDVKMGSFHTLDIEANRDIRIIKTEGGWDSIALGRVDDACVEGRGAEVGAVIVGEGEYEQYYLTFRSQTW